MGAAWDKQELGTDVVARFEAIFAMSVDLIETDFYTVFPLLAATLHEADAEAVQLPWPPGANLVKIRETKTVVRRTWLALAK